MLVNTRYSQVVGGAIANRISADIRGSGLIEMCHLHKYCFNINQDIIEL